MLRCLVVCCSLLLRAVVAESGSVDYLFFDSCDTDGCVRVLQRVAVRCSALQRVAACCSVLHSVAVCCSVLQCVAVYCSVYIYYIYIYILYKYIYIYTYIYIYIIYMTHSFHC